MLRAHAWLRIAPLLAECFMQRALHQRPIMQRLGFHKPMGSELHPRPQAACRVIPCATCRM